MKVNIKIFLNKFMGKCMSKQASIYYTIFRRVFISAGKIHVHSLYIVLMVANIV